MAETITPDLCVIGAGPGGLAAVAEARALGVTVVLVERGRLGGSNLNTGTVPAQAMAAAAARAHAMRTAPAFGIAADEPRINTRRVHDHVEQVIAALAPNAAASHLAALGVQVLEGEAKFADPRSVVVGDINVRARRFIIATGARSVVPPIPGLDGVPYFTSETIFDNTRKLTHLAVIGGGTTGLELAQSFSRLGTQVTVLDPGSPLAFTDPELAAVVLERLGDEGVDVRGNTAVAAIQPRSQGIGVVIRSGDADAMLDVSHVLVAHARVPDLEPLDLDKAAIRRRKDDARQLALSPALRTTNRRVYAIGDAAGTLASGQLAAWHARLVVRRSLLGLPGRFDASVVPAALYTDPELAEVGLTEAAARARLGDRFTILRAGFADNDRARATRATYGVVKLVVGRGGRILGAGVVGDRAAELAAFFAYAIGNRLGVQSLRKFVAPHPTFAEVAEAIARQFDSERGTSPLGQRLAALLRHLP